MTRELQDHIPGAQYVETEAAPGDVAMTEPSFEARCIALRYVGVHDHMVELAHQIDAAIAEARRAGEIAMRERDIAALRDPEGEIYQAALKLGVISTLHDVADYLAALPLTPEPETSP